MNITLGLMWSGQMPEPVFKLESANLYPRHLVPTFPNDQISSRNRTWRTFSIQPRTDSIAVNYAYLPSSQSPE